MKKRVILIAVGVIAISGLLIAAVGGYFGYVKFLKPVLAYQKAVEVMKEFESAEFDIVADYDARFPSLGMNMDMKMEGEGKIDITAKRMQMDMAFDLMGESIEFSQIIIGDDIYLKMDSEGWEKVSMDEVVADMGMSVEDFKDQQMWASNASAEMEYLGIEEIDGKEYYAYSLKVDGDSFQDLVDSMMESMSGAEVSIDSVTIESVSMKTWVDVKTSYPYKEQVTIKNARFQAGEPIGEMVMDMVMEMVYYNVNEPVKIEKPSI